jgi:hypothetical protein
MRPTTQMSQTWAMRATATMATMRAMAAMCRAFREGCGDPISTTGRLGMG